MAVATDDQDERLQNFINYFNISDLPPILNEHSTRMPPKIADKFSELFETLPTSLGGWESFGTDLQLVVHNLPDFSSRNRKL